MIQVTYESDLTPGPNLATQLTNMSFTPLDQGELTLLGLVILSDPGATWTGTKKQRVVQFTETAEFLARVGPASNGAKLNAKRKAFVRGLFTLKIAKRIHAPVTETIALF